MVQLRVGPQHTQTVPPVYRVEVVADRDARQHPGAVGRRGQPVGVVVIQIQRAGSIHDALRQTAPVELVELDRGGAVAVIHANNLAVAVVGVGEGDGIRADQARPRAGLDQAAVIRVGNRSILGIGLGNEQPARAIIGPGCGVGSAGRGGRPTPTVP